MLVLSRKANESVVIDDRIIVTVLGIHGGKVRIGIEAPGEVPIRRQELEVRMTEGNFPASSLPRTSDIALG